LESSTGMTISSGRFPPSPCAARADCLDSENRLTMIQELQQLKTILDKIILVTHQEGTVYRETIVRLADHAQSRAEQEVFNGDKERGEVPRVQVIAATECSLEPIELSGLDGSNPLAFLAALGTLRLADRAFEGNARLSWRQRGKWLPVLHIPKGFDEEQLISHLYSRAHRAGNVEASIRAAELEIDYQAKRKAARQSFDSVKARKLRGQERDAAIANEVTPLEVIANAARSEWLSLLDVAVPAPFLSLGKALSVTKDEFRAFAMRALERLLATGPRERFDSDFAASFGSEACVSDAGKIVPTEFQLITGSGHQYFLETIGTLIEGVTAEQLRRALFAPWTYRDFRLSLRWDPLDDRRYATRWADPSDDVVVGEHGANLLAAFALPLFPLIPTKRGAVTTGFGTPRVFTWPIWCAGHTVDVARSLLACEELQRVEPRRNVLHAIGIADAFSIRKIQVGSGLNTKLNFTAAVPV
jgi:hypothetical protein